MYLYFVSRYILINILYYYPSLLINRKGYHSFGIPDLVYNLILNTTAFKEMFDVVVLKRVVHYIIHFYHMVYDFRM